MLRMKTVSLDMFFDTDRVKRAAGAAARRNLSKGGAFVRVAVPSSIRKRKGISAPGQPPNSHTGLLAGVWAAQAVFIRTGVGRKTAN